MFPHNDYNIRTSASMILILIPQQYFFFHNFPKNKQAKKPNCSNFFKLLNTVGQTRTVSKYNRLKLTKFSLKSGTFRIRIRLQIWPNIHCQLFGTWQTQCWGLIPKLNTRIKFFIIIIIKPLLNFFCAECSVQHLVLCGQLRCTAHSIIQKSTLAIHLTEESREAVTLFLIVCECPLWFGHTLIM